MLSERCNGCWVRTRDFAHGYVFAHERLRGQRVLHQTVKKKGEAIIATVAGMGQKRRFRAKGGSLPGRRCVELLHGRCRLQ
jgi:hypothetical protein